MQWSLPARGVWIEISKSISCPVIRFPSLPARGVWIEINLLPMTDEEIESLPARGVWIEIHLERKTA